MRKLFNVFHSQYADRLCSTIIWEFNSLANFHKIGVTQFVCNEKGVTTTHSALLFCTVGTTGVGGTVYMLYNCEWT